MDRSGIPIEFLVGEIVAFPLSSVYSFEHPINSFYSDFAGNRMKYLWRNAESLIVQTVPDISIDMVLAIRDQFWFGKNLKKETISEYLIRIAELFFEVRGAVAIPKVVGERLEDGRDKVAAVTKRNNTLRWFSFSLPMDLFLGALYRIGAPVKIDYLSPQLFRSLHDKGYVETHLHVGAAMEFPEFWVSTLCRFVESDFRDDSFKSPGAVFNEGKDLGPWILRGALTRTILAKFLFKSGGEDLNFYKWIEGVFFKDIAVRHGITVLSQIRLALKEFLAGRKCRPSPVSPYIRNIFREYSWGGNLPKNFNSPDQIHLNDPISFLVSTGEGNPTPEVQFVSKGLAYIKKKNSLREEDSLFASFFWQVIRIRCIYYRHVTQRPMTPGLLWFVRHYDRNKPGRDKVSTKMLLRSAACTSGIDKGLRSLEVRNTSEKSVADILKLVKDSISAFRESEIEKCLHKREKSKSSWSPEEMNIEFGWIIHFAKIRGEDVLMGHSNPRWKNTNADPKPFRRQWRNRYAGYYRKQKGLALILAQALLNFPGAIRVIRGLDVCTDEMGVPSWVFVPFFRYIREAGNIASRYLLTKFNEEVPPLKMTIHTGEDYVHLLGGLRRVEESIRYFNLGPGDRIGHGIALGTDPEEWAKKKNKVAMNRENRLFDLVWEWSQYSSNRIFCDAGRMAYIEREISRLSNKIFSRVFQPYQLEYLLNDLHNESRLRILNYPDCRRMQFMEQKNTGNIISKKEEEIDRYNLLYDYLSDPLIFKNGHETEWIDIISEIEPMKVLQNYIRQIIVNLGLVVEVNPTSNLLIGNLNDLKSHPFWKFNPPLPEHDIQPVAICIGSDDPLTFATSLRQEYALLQESLMEGGLSASQAWHWVEKVRDTGMSSRFTLPLKNNHNDIIMRDNQLYLHHAIGLNKYIVDMP